MPTAPPRHRAKGAELADRARRREWEKRTKVDRSVYKSSAWRTARREWLRGHPNCVVCGAPGRVVDHIRPHRGESALFWNPANWQTMCDTCHQRKRQSERTQ